MAYQSSAIMQSNARVNKLHQCFLKFGTDSLENINVITSTIGELLNATSAFYNRLDGDLICSWGKWNSPGDLKTCEKPENRICNQVISNSQNDVLHIRDLQNTIFAKTDPTVVPYKLQTYLGKAVSFNNKHVGSLCVVFQTDFVPDEEELKLFDILTSAVAVEENRLNYIAQLEKSEKQYKDLYQNSTIGIYRSTPEGKIIFANTKFIELLGYNSLEELQKINIQESLYLNKDSRNKFISILETEEIIHGYTVKLQKKDGGKLTVRESARVIKNENEKIVYYEGTVEDITKQKEIELALLQSNARFKSIFESSGSGIVITNSENYFVEVNPRFCQLLGYSKEELFNMTLTEITHPEDIEKSKKLIQELHKGLHKHIQLEKRYIKRDGSTLWGLVTLGILNNDLTDKVYTIRIFEDISEKMYLMEKLSTRDKILSAINFSTETFLKTLDWHANIQEILKRLGKAVDVSRAYIFRNHLSDNQDVLMSQCFKWNAENNGTAEINEKSQNISYKKAGLERLLNILRKNNVYYGIVKDLPEQERLNFDKIDIKSLLIVPIYELDQLWGFIGFDECRYERVWSKMEIEALRSAANTLGVAVKRKAFEEELLSAKLKAEESDKLKSQFLAQISHEIRSPINTILSFTSLLKEDIEGEITNELTNSFSIIKSAGERLTRTIDLILNMSEIQTGSYEYSPRNVDIYSDVLRNLIIEAKISAKSKGLEFKVTKNTNKTSKTVDVYTVSQIFVNLLDNAFKYTEKGDVELGINTTDNGELEIYVSDTGIGIAPEYIPKLFKPFSQEEQGYTRTFEGNGLGLALVKNYCEMNNAEIKVNSQKGIGTTFRVIFKNGKESY